MMMENTKHTAGPWLVEYPMGDGPGDHLWIVQDGTTSEVYDWRNLAVVCSDDPSDIDSARPITVAERNANARLITAAPDLLDVAEKYVAAWDAGTGTVYLIEEFRAAIKKAKGE